MIARAGALAAALAAACSSSSPQRGDDWPPPVGYDVLSRVAAPTPRPAAVAILGSATSQEPSGELDLDALMTSVEANFPLILAALEEVEIAHGKLVSARGGFDTRLEARGTVAPEGFYENEVFDAWIEQPTTLWGATFLGGYRIGSGDFAVYDGKQKTNAGGEYRAGVSLPLLQGGEIDPRRVELWRSRLGVERAEPIVLQKRLEATRKAASAYWSWVAAGAKRAIAQRQLELAQDRQAQVELAVAEGELAEINLIDNRRLIVERESNRVRAERGLQQAAIQLSLYWRDAQGRPRVPAPEDLPPAFPEPRAPSLTLVPEGERVALERRPEIRALELELEALELELRLVGNQWLPRLDLGVFASQDVGAAVNTPDDKDPFELEALVRFSMPLQRRKPAGDRRSLEARIAKLRRETSFERDLVVTDVQDAESALTQSWQRLAQARANVELAERLEEAERLQLAAGESDLFRVNLREQQTAAAAAAVVDVLAEHFKALAEYRAVLGVPYDGVRAP